MVTKQKNGRGRPRKFDIDKAIAQAMDLFWRHGYDGVGVAELSKTMGITAPSLYSAFGSKRQLFEQVLERYTQTQGGWISDALDQEEALEQAIANLFLKAAEVYATDPERPGCLVIDGTRNCGDEAAKALTTAVRQATRKLIRDRIATGVPKLASAQVEALADYVVMILVGLSGSARDGASPSTLQASANIAAAVFLQQDFLEQCFLQQDFLQQNFHKDKQ